MKSTSIKGKVVAAALTVIAAVSWGLVGMNIYQPSAETKPAHAAVMANISDIAEEPNTEADDTEEINNTLISPAAEVGDVDADAENIVEDKEDAQVSTSTPQATNTPATTTVTPDEAKEENPIMTTEVVEEIIPFVPEEDEIVAPKIILPDPAVITTYQSTVKVQYVDGSAATASVWVDGVLVTVEGEVTYDYQLATVSCDSSVNDELLSSTDGFVVYTTYIFTIKNPEPVVAEEDPAPTDDDQDQNQDKNKKEDTSIDEHTTTDATQDEVKPEDSTPEQTETVEQTDKDEDKVEIIADPVEDEDITNDETNEIPQPTVEPTVDPDEEIGPAITYSEYTYTDEYNGYTYTVVVGTTTTTDGQTTTVTETETVLEFGIQISESSVTMGPESGMGYAWENYDQLYQAIDALMASSI